MLPLAFTLFGCLLVAVVARYDASGVDANPFRSNLNLVIPDYDEALQKHLWHGIQDEVPRGLQQKNAVITYEIHKKQAKRAPGMGPYGPLMTIPCLFCESKRVDQPVSHAGFTKEEMFKRIIPRGNIGSCLFYGQREPGRLPPRLSGEATAYSCSRPFIFKTIWQMWESDKFSMPAGADDLQSCFPNKNFYCLDYWNPKCCWLNPLLGTDKEKWKDNGMKYFRAMSRAMAMSCRNTVYTLIDDPNKVMDQIEAYKSTPSIWINDEVDELRTLWRAGLVHTVKAIKYMPFMFGMIEVDVTDKVMLGTGSRMAKRSDEEEREMAVLLKLTKEMAARQAKSIMDGEIEVRGLDGQAFVPDVRNGTQLEKRVPFCTDSYLQENPDLDYFG